MAHKKSWTEKLHHSNDLPKIVQITGRMARSWGEGSCVVPAPIEVDHLMRQVKRGRVITSHELRTALATYHETDLACPSRSAFLAGSPPMPPWKRKSRESDARPLGGGR